jgi:hypothetical protein
VHESIRDYLRRLRREALRQRRIKEPPLPKCEVCCHSIAYLPMVKAYKGEEDCPHCREQRREYHRTHGNTPSVIRIVDAPSREEVEEWRRRDGTL